MTISTKAVALAVSGAFVLSIGAAVVNAAENPFAIKSLSKGYQVADHHEEGKMKDGKCGEGKCGADMKKDAAKGKEGSCGHDKAKDGSCAH